MLANVLHIPTMPMYVYAHISMCIGTSCCCYLDAIFNVDKRAFMLLAERSENGIYVGLLSV